MIVSPFVLVALLSIFFFVPQPSLASNTSRARRSIVTRHGFKISFDFDSEVKPTFNVKDDLASDPPPRKPFKVMKPEKNPEPNVREIMDMSLASITNLKLYPLTCAKPDASVCYEPFVCFYTHQGPLRHVCRLPQSPFKLATHFLMYIKNNANKEYDLHYSEKTYWNLIPSGAKVAIIVHGNFEWPDYPIFQHMKNEILAYTEYDVVILVDYHRQSGMNFHFDANQVYSNTQVIGREITYLTRQLMIARNIPAKNFYHICFSLGCVVSHMSSLWARERYNFKIGRITVMEMVNIVTERFTEMLINKDDANFVDAYHSSGAGDSRISFTSNFLGRIGVSRPMGHVDFYVNNGRIQPHCLLTPYFWCSHLVARRMFMYSIRVCRGKYKSHACNFFDVYANGNEDCIEKDTSPAKGSNYVFIATSIQVEDTNK